MASTYALPMAPATQARGHTRSQSQYSTYSNGSTRSLSPVRENGHSHQRSGDMSRNGQLHGAVRSAYADFNAHAHEHNHSHSHSHTNSNGSAWTIQPLVNGRSKGRPRGESDLGRTPPRKNASAGSYAFSPVSPIQESTPSVPLPQSSYEPLGRLRANVC